MAVLLTLTTASCLREQPRLGFRPEDELRGHAARAPVARSWTPRTQHTRGHDGQDLFPCPSPDGRTLYYATSRFSPNFHLVAQRLGETQISFLTTGEFSSIQPAVSPDGRFLAFASDREGDWDIYVTPTRPDGKVRRVVQSPASALGPRWSPDGTRIACFRRGGQARWEIWILDAATGAQSYLTDGLFPAWSPDGEWIAFQRPRERGAGWFSIWKIRVAGGPPVQLAAGESDRWGAVTPTWSPSGRWLAFTAVGKTGAGLVGTDSGAGEERDVYVMTAAGTHLTNVTGDRPGVAEWNPRFGPDGSLYFNADEDGGAHVWSVQVALTR